MSEAQHTPGDWRACKGGDCVCGMVWGPDIGKEQTPLVAIVQGPQHMLGDDSPDCVPRREQQRANARLIKASPAMYDALKLLANEDNYMYPGFDPCEIASAALAEAKGESNE